MQQPLYIVSPCYKEMYLRYTAAICWIVCLTSGFAPFLKGVKDDFLKFKMGLLFYRGNIMAEIMPHNFFSYIEAISIYRSLFFMLHTCNAVLVAAFMAPNGYITCTIQTQLHFHI